MSEKPRRRVWVQNVAVTTQVLQTRLDVAAAKGLSGEQQAVAAGVAVLLGRARDAAYRDNPVPRRWANWWRGTLVDAAHQNLHAAKAQIVDLYDEAELAAELPVALARARGVMHRDDPRNVDPREWATMPLASRRARLRRIVQDSYSSLDGQHERLRSFRNIVLLTAALVAVLVTVTVVAVSQHPSVMPLCFSDMTPGKAGSTSLNCPTRTGVGGPSGGDILIVALLGLLGGALTAAVSIRNLKGTSTPYDVPVALAMLKVPLGAFTAILGLVAIQGDFVPGLSVLDSQEQILAYALLLGFAQQVFTRLLDRRAQSLLDGLPTKDSAPGSSPTPPGGSSLGSPGPAPSPDEPRESATDAAVPAEPSAPPATPQGPLPVDDSPGASPEPSAPAGTAALQPNPEGDEEDQVQDDAGDVMPDAPELDTR